MIIHKIIRKIQYIYQKNESKEYQKRVASCGKNVNIEYPCILGEPDRIEIGDNTTILSYGRFQTFKKDCEESKLTIGANCFLGYRTCILASAPVEIGDNVLFASDISIISHNHGMENNGIPFINQELVCKKIKIGNNVWVGDKCVILPGVTIGDNVVIGAGSIVTKDIPSNSVAVGAPAKVIKSL